MTDITADFMPVFVYGTLRPGWGNARLWAGRGDAHHDGAATVRGFRLVSGGPFPFAVPDADSVATGALIYPSVAEYADVLDDLDRLEGYPRFYDRMMVVVDTPAGHVKAWIYTPARPIEYADLPPVEGNDWSAAEGRRMVRR